MVLPPEKNHPYLQDSPDSEASVSLLDITTSRRGKATMLTINGSINSSTADEFGQAMKDLINDEESGGAKTRIIIDFRDCVRLSSAGLREMTSALIQIQYHLDKKHGKFHNIKPISIIIADTSDDVKRTLSIIGFDDGDIFPLYDGQ